MSVWGSFMLSRYAFSRDVLPLNFAPPRLPKRSELAEVPAAPPRYREVRRFELRRFACRLEDVVSMRFAFLDSGLGFSGDVSDCLRPRLEISTTSDTRARSFELVIGKIAPTNYLQYPRIH